MGRWAQRRRGNGGGGTGAAPILLVSAVPITNLLITVTFDAAVSDADFANSDFTTTPGNFNPTTIGNNGPAALDLVFVDDVSAETDLTYSGSAPNVLSPQSVAIL